METIDRRKIDMSSEEFRKAGHLLVDLISDFLDELPAKAVTSGEEPEAIREILKDVRMPEEGMEIEELVTHTSELLFNHSLFNGHPRFWGYITSSAAPVGALADFLAASVNPNLGAYMLSPMATEIERQTIKWLAEFIGYSVDCSGVFVSGGNMANITGFLAARRAKSKGNIRKDGNFVNGNEQGSKGMLVYCPLGTHTWIDKASDISGLGTEAVRWIDLNKEGQMDCEKLEEEIILDIENGYLPFMVVGNAGSVGTGIIDPFDKISQICNRYDLWFHIDGAYGIPAAALSEYKDAFKGLEFADSIALDPHKWFYSPLEAGCILVKNSQLLKDTFSHHPDYYNFEPEGIFAPVNYHEYSLQNSRGFRALKVWMALKLVGRKAYIDSIRKDIQLAEEFFDLIKNDNEIQAVTRNLSIATFRYFPTGYSESAHEIYLNQLNEAILNKLQEGGEVFLSNAVINGKYCLRICIVNFRTQFNDLKVLAEIVKREGKLLHSKSVTAF